MKIAVVIAAYNEVGNIAPLTERLVNTLDALPGASWSLIYVIEGTDGTLEIAREFAARRPEIQILYAEKPSGLGRAFRRGFDAVASDTDFVVTMDADLNHQPEEIPALLAALRERKADIVVGSRRLNQSSVQGTPFWKRSLSQFGNRLMHIFMGMRVQDLTSGFRIYRTAALKQLHFENMGFAFLPEVLIQAAGRRLTIIEQPIQFVFRTVGESKMRIGSTSLSYLRLFLRQSRGLPTLVAVLLLLLGTGVHIAFCFPPHRSHADSDAVLAGLCALDVRDGQLPLFFPGGYRLSSQSCYMTAGFFHVFGPNRAALGATTVTYGVLFLVFGWLAIRECAGAWPALAGLLLLALPPLQFWLVTYPAWGYAEVMAFSVCTLWLGLRLLRPEVSKRLFPAILFGLLLGVSFWTSPQTLMISIPLIGLILWRRSVGWRNWVAIACGAMVAAIPYGLVVARFGLAPFTHSFATQPTSGTSQLASNAHYLFTYTLPLLLFSKTSSEISASSLASLRIIVVSLGFACLLMIGLRGDNRSDYRRPSRVLVLFPIIVLLFGFALYIGSGAGGVRGWTVRYVAPLYLMIPLGSALLLSRLRTDWAKAVTVLGVLVLAGLQSMEYPIFNSQVREQQTASLVKSETTIAWLRNNHINLAIGDYWTVYYLNFDGLRSVIALPLDAPEDYFDYGRELDSRRELHAALLDRNEAHLDDWVKRLQEPGRIERIDSDLYAFVIEDPADQRIVDKARATAQ